jgi:hypothetical protein
VKQTCAKGGYFYTESGSFQSGPAFVRVSITDLLSPAQIGIFADEISEKEIADADDHRIEAARDRAVDRFLFAKANGFDVNFPEHFREAA